MGLDIYFHKRKRETLYEFRKVNFLVSFFSERIDGKIENCVPVKVNREDIVVLKDRCEIVLAHHELAEQLLPTQEGFFFGDTDYDEYYFEQVEDVLETCKDLLQDFKELEDGECIEFEIWY